jgi:hypothetical protein
VISAVPSQKQYKVYGPTAFHGVAGEAELVERIVSRLAVESLGIRDLAWIFGKEFNATIRANELTAYDATQRNDGSFKKWIEQCGFEVRRDSTVSLPPSCTWSLPPSCMLSETASTASFPSEDAGQGQASYPAAFHGVHGEAELVQRIASWLATGPREFQELNYRFSKDFAETLRKSRYTPYAPDGKNDGSFKKWIASCGFEIGPLFDRNKVLVSLPQPRPKTTRFSKTVVQASTDDYGATEDEKEPSVDTFNNAEEGEDWTTYLMEQRQEQVEEEVVWGNLSSREQVTCDYAGITPCREATTECGQTIKAKKRGVNKIVVRSTNAAASSCVDESDWGRTLVL